MKFANVVRGPKKKPYSGELGAKAANEALEIFEKKVKKRLYGK